VRTLAIVLAVASLVGCAPAAPQGLVLEGVVAADDACEFALSNLLMVDGTLDTSRVMDASARPEGIRYVAVFRATSYLPELGYPRAAIVHTLDLAAAEVTLLGGAGPGGLLEIGLPNPYRVVGDGWIPLDGGPPATGLAAVELLPPEYGNRLAGLDGTVTVSVRLIGYSSAFDDVVMSNELTFPIQLCDGCLLACAPVDAPSCFPGQDHASLVACP
jgi:hypothetical protein